MAPSRRQIKLPASGNSIESLSSCAVLPLYSCMLDGSCATSALLIPPAFASFQSRLTATCLTWQGYSCAIQVHCSHSENSTVVRDSLSELDVRAGPVMAVII